MLNELYSPDRTGQRAGGINLLGPGPFGKERRLASILEPDLRPFEQANFANLVKTENDILIFRITVYLAAIFFCVSFLTVMDERAIAAVFFGLSAICFAVAAYREYCGPSRKFDLTPYREMAMEDYAKIYLCKHCAIVFNQGSFCHLTDICSLYQEKALIEAVVRFRNSFYV